MCTYGYVFTLCSAFCSCSILEDMSLMYRKIFENNLARKQRRLPTSCWLIHAYKGCKTFLLGGSCLLSIHSMYRRRTEKMGCEPCQIGRPKHGCCSFVESHFSDIPVRQSYSKTNGKACSLSLALSPALALFDCLASTYFIFSVKGKACFSTILRPQS